MVIGLGFCLFGSGFRFSVVGLVGRLRQALASLGGGLFQQALSSNCIEQPLLRLSAALGPISRPRGSVHSLAFSAATSLFAVAESGGRRVRQYIRLN